MAGQKTSLDAAIPAQEGNGLLSRIVEGLYDPAHISGVVVHGSWARGTNNAASDVDVMLLQRAGPMSEQTSLVDGTPVDIYRGTFSDLKEKLNADHPLNNNFVLNALHEGMVCIDRGGWVGALKAHADLRWAEGPSVMSPTEMRAAKLGIFRMLHGAQRLLNRTAASKSDALIAETRSHQVVIQAVYLYHRVRRRWTTGFPLMLDRLKAEGSPLYDLWDHYVEADSQHERVKLASCFVDLVFEKDSSR
jgi:Nucleotidyltransferase domain